MYAGRAAPGKLLLCQKTERLIMESMPTPWGRAVTMQKLAEGIFWVETADNGGLLIEVAQARMLLSEQALKMGLAWEHFLAYEQEHAMSVVFYEHPELYPWVEEELTEKLAADSLRLSNPGYFDHE
jgi:hypothetical protein